MIIGTGYPNWKTSPRVYPWKGLSVNPEAGAKPPGPWVNELECEVCAKLHAAGELPAREHWTGKKRRRRSWLAPHTFQDHRGGGYDFQTAANRLRVAAKADGDEGGGYRSRRAVLYWLHVLKLESFYLEHMMCGQLHHELEQAKAGCGTYMTGACGPDLCPWCDPSHPCQDRIPPAGPDHHEPPPETEDHQW